jgi:YmgG-like glycine-zipper protein
VRHFPVDLGLKAYNLLQVWRGLPQLEEALMNRKFGLIGMALFAMAAGCSRDNNKVDDPLKNDLSLAAQQRPGQLDSLSAAERGYTNVPANTRAGASTTAPRRTSSTTHRSTSSGTRSSGTSAGSSSGGSVASAPTTTEKHTKRDAAIGAAAGAVIGATTSRNKVKGAVIGGAAGGILGAIIGNNVDVKKKKP